MKETTVEDLVKQAKDRFISKIEQQLGEDDLPLSSKGRILVQGLLRRGDSLVRATITADRDKNLVAAALAVRAHFETTGMLACIHKKVQSHLSNKCCISEVEDLIFRMMMGAKTIKPGEGYVLPKPVHVLKGIRLADEYLASIGVDDKMCEDNYDFLSDVCHPNFQGTMSCFTVEDDIAAFMDQETIYGRFGKSIAPAILISGFVFFDLYDRLWESLGKIRD